MPTFCLIFLIAFIVLCILLIGLHTSKRKKKVEKLKLKDLKSSVTTINGSVSVQGSTKLVNTPVRNSGSDSGSSSCSGGSYD